VGGIPANTLRGPRRKAMYTCVICQFEVELDAAIAPVAGRRCICLACYTRATDTLRTMPKGLRHEVATVAEEATVAPDAIIDSL
jgi:hypothetical protein